MTKSFGIELKHFRRKELLDSEPNSSTCTRQLLQEKIGDVYASTDNHDEALEMYKDALFCFYCENEIPSELLNKIADIHKKRGDYVETIQVYIDLGNKHFDNDDFEVALTFFRKALEVENVDRITQLHLQISKSLEMIGEIFWSKGQLNLALDATIKSIEIWRKSPEAYKLDISKSLERVGDIFLEQEHISEALIKFQEALAFRTQGLCTESVKSMILNEKLASVYISLGYKEKAIATYMEVLRWKKGRGSSILENVFTLGKMYSRCGDTEKAISTFQEALSLQVESKTTDQIFTASIHSVIGSEYIARDPPDNVEACKSYAEALRIWAIHDEDNFSTATAYLKLGEVQANLFQFTEAIRSFKSCLNIFRKSDCDSSKKETLRVLLVLAKAQTEVGNFEESLACLEQSLTLYNTDAAHVEDKFESFNDGKNLYKNIPGYISAADRLSTFLEDVANIHYELGIVYQRKGTKLDLQKALLSFDEFCQIRRRQRGNYHYDVALAIEAIGMTLLKLGETSKAMNKFMETALILKNTGDSVSYARVLTNLGQTYMKEGDFAAAVVNFMQAFRLRLKEKDESNCDKVCVLFHDFPDLIDIETGRIKNFEALTHQLRRDNLLGELKKKLTTYCLSHEQSFHCP